MATKDTVRAFTSSYDTIRNKLINKSTIVYQDKNLESTTLWDTGATISCISHQVVSKLSMTSTGIRKISTPSGDTEVDTYLVNIILPNNLDTGLIEVCETEIGNQGVDILVGMDIINKGDFSVTNYNGKTVFTFSTPSIKTIDFVKKISIKKITRKSHM